MVEMVDIDDMRAMHADEAGRIKPLLELAEAHSHQMGAGERRHLGIILRARNQHDVANMDRRNIIAGARQVAFERRGADDRDGRS